MHLINLMHFILKTSQGNCIVASTYYFILFGELPIIYIKLMTVWYYINTESNCLSSIICWKVWPCQKNHPLSIAQEKLNNTFKEDVFWQCGQFFVLCTIKREKAMKCWKTKENKLYCCQNILITLITRRSLLSNSFGLTSWWFMQ